MDAGWRRMAAHAMNQSPSNPPLLPDAASAALAGSASNGEGQRLKGRRAHVFLSFKTAEREIAARLKDAIVAAGYKVWWQEDLQCGHEWHGDIDRALTEAGCVVVLWSAESMKSPWVRHEASQAMSRAVYAPARLEPLEEIGSPLNRIQATNLIAWNGDQRHPGLQHLLARIEELLPRPLPTRTRTLQFLRNTWTSFLAAFAVIAMVSLFRIRADVVNQVAEQARLSAQMERTLQPLQDLERCGGIDFAGRSWSRKACSRDAPSAKCADSFGRGSSRLTAQDELLFDADVSMWLSFLDRQDN